MKLAETKKVPTFATQVAPGRLATLLVYLESDPDNVSLLGDAAEQAIGERQPAMALDLLARRKALREPEPAQINIAGLARLATHDFAGAAAEFEAVRQAGIDDPPVRFNLAWACAMLKDELKALELLDDETTTRLPQAATLEVQLLHGRGDFELAADRARHHLTIHPDDQGLNAATSVLALDVEDDVLARSTAARGGDHPDALATRGTLALGDERATEAFDQFDQAIARNDKSPRAWVGRGLARLMTGDNEHAPADMDRGAELFEDHLGSWIAAGWAYVVTGDFDMARKRFEKALALDGSFAEAQGSLAALNAMEGKIEVAERGARTALRLDRECFSAALAMTLISSGRGDPDKARQIFRTAIDTPISAGGRTIAQAMARMGLARG